MCLVAKGSATTFGARRTGNKTSQFQKYSHRPFYWRDTQCVHFETVSHRIRADNEPARATSVHVTVLNQGTVPINKSTFARKICEITHVL
jgi:hypothetical protein